MCESSSRDERVEEHHLVEPVQELRLERRADDGHHRLALLLVVERRVDEVGRAQVRGEDQHHVAEVHGAALAVGEPAVVEDLQQDVEDLGVRLLHLVEQHDGVGTPAHRLGELAALVVPDVAGGRADQPGHRVLLGVLAHVDADDRALVVEQEVRERLGQLGLADAGRAQEQERPGGAVGVGDARAGAAHGVGDGGDGGPLADQPAADHLLHAQQLGGLALEQPAGRDARPGLDDVGDLLGADLVAHHRVGDGLLVRGGLHELRLQLGDPAVEDLAGAARSRPRAGTGRPASAARRSACGARRRPRARPSPGPTGPPARAAPPRGRRGRRAAAPAGRGRRRRPRGRARAPPSSSGPRCAGAGRSRPGWTRSPSAAGTPTRRRGRSPCRAAGGR